MLILAFDTTSERGGVAIYRDTECLASVPNEGPSHNYSVTLFEMVDCAIAGMRARSPAGQSGDAERSLSLRDIELFAPTIGPGSFTGIRVGLAAAKGWAKAFNRPVAGVSALGALVEEARPETEWAAPIIDARRGEFFLGLFRRASGTAFFQAEGEGLALRPNELRTLFEEHARGDAPGGVITCLVREQDRIAQGLREILPSSTRWQSVAGALLGAIARIAHRAYKEGKLKSPEKLDAYYIRRSDAELQAPQDQKQISELERRGRTSA